MYAKSTCTYSQQILLSQATLVGIYTWNDVKDAPHSGH